MGTPGARVYAARMTLRRDARANRERLVAAAVEVFRDAGADAPLDLVARRAEVGRGTLYRHFPDRGALVAAVLRRQVEALEALAGERADPDLLEQLLVEMGSFVVELPGAMAVVRGRALPREERDDVVARSRALLERALGPAVAAGRVDPATTVDDVLLLVGMVDGVAASAASAASTTAPGSGRRAVELAVRAIRAPGRVGEPVPAPRLRVGPAPHAPHAPAPS